jgi:hypothetical protein
VRLIRSVSASCRETASSTKVEAELIRDGYEIRKGEIEPNTHREAHAHGFDARVFVLDGSITFVFGSDRAAYGALRLVQRARGDPS